jgi:HK97 family phage portal protein
MGRLQQLVTWLTEPLEQRSGGLDPALDPDLNYPTIDEQLYARQRSQAGSVMRASVREAMGIPAVFRAVTLLATVAASLQMKEYRDGREIPATPFIRRPQRAWTPGAYTRDVVQYMATRGESIQLVLERDVAGFPSNVVPVPPERMLSDWNGIEHDWYTRSARTGKEVRYRREDVIHIPLIRDPGNGRGVGPLQLAGIAMNVAVEAERWASRFFAGSMPSVFLESKVPLAGDDPQTIKDKWMSDPPNVPKVGYGIEPHMLALNPEAAQLTGVRMQSRGEVALAFGIPGRLLEYAESGTSITYANVGDLATELVRLTLAPMYLEPIEQAMSDLRPRGTEVRFDVSGFERADTKTRYEIHQLAIAAGIYTAEYAAEQEGIQGQFPEVVPAPSLRRIV